MELQEKEAVQELLKKIPEDKLKEAVGGLSERNKNILGAIGLFLGGAAIGVGGKLAWDKWGKKEKDIWKDFKWDEKWYKKGDDIDVDKVKELFTHLPEDEDDKQAAWLKTNLGLEVTFDEEGNISGVKKVAK